MDRPRCYDHRDRETFPQACPTCNRIRVEQNIVKRTVSALLKAGYALNIDNGGDACELRKDSIDRATVLGAMMATDDEYLIARRYDPVSGTCGDERYWIRFVYGNSGFDVISDYHTALEDVLKPVNDYADTLG